MNPVDQTPPLQSAFIALEFDLRHPPEKVWRALTQPELLSRWLLTVAHLKLEAGATFCLQAPPQQGWDGVVACQFVEILRCRRLSYTWRVGELNTVVTFTLTPTPAGTHLSLVQSGFAPAQKQNFGGARYGWKMMGERLVGLLEQP